MEGEGEHDHGKEEHGHGEEEEHGHGEEAEHGHGMIKWSGTFDTQKATSSFGSPKKPKTSTPTQR